MFGASRNQEPLLGVGANETLAWPFLAGLTDSELAKYRIQVISDVYRAMQSRMDGYRQAASAIFIGVIAAILAIDSAFFRTALDIFRTVTDGSGHHAAPEPRRDVSIIALGALLIVVFVAAAGWGALLKLHRIFAEMTSIVYKIDEVNGVWNDRLWAGSRLFPKNFMINPKADKSNVSQDLNIDPHLTGWFDPAIRSFLYSIRNIGLAHFVVYAYFGYYYL